MQDTNGLYDSALNLSSVLNSSFKGMVFCCFAGKNFIQNVIEVDGKSAKLMLRYATHKYCQMVCEYKCNLTYASSLLHGDFNCNLSGIFIQT